jgi:hypothetical protein
MSLCTAIMRSQSRKSSASPPLSRAREEPRRHRVWSGEVARRKDTFLFRLFAAGFSYGDDRDDSAIAPPRVFPTGAVLTLRFRWPMAAGAAMGSAAEREPRYPSSPPRRLSLVPAPARRVTGAGEWRCD